MTTGRCMKCRENREMKDEEVTIMKNGMKAMKGLCSVCGTKMFKIVGKATPEEVEAFKKKNE